jgi:hypothetical protein
MSKAAFVAAGTPWRRGGSFELPRCAGRATEVSPPRRNDVEGVGAEGW